MPDLRENSCSLLSTTTVALNANATTVLYTVPPGKRCILAFAILVVGADAVTADIQIGQNAATDDFCGPSDLGNIDAQYDACILQPMPVDTPGSVTILKSYAAGTDIEAEVTNQAGDGATNTLYLFGMLY